MGKFLKMINDLGSIQLGIIKNILKIILTTQSDEIMVSDVEDIKYVLLSLYQDLEPECFGRAKLHFRVL